MNIQMMRHVVDSKVIITKLPVYRIQAQTFAALQFIFLNQLMQALHHPLPLEALHNWITVDVESVVSYFPSSVVAQQCSTEPLSLRKLLEATQHIIREHGSTGELKECGGAEIKREAEQWEAECRKLQDEVASLRVQLNSDHKPHDEAEKDSRVQQILAGEWVCMGVVSHNS